jgi:hypothetical protein
LEWSNWKCLPSRAQAQRKAENGEKATPEQISLSFLLSVDLSTMASCVDEKIDEKKKSTSRFPSLSKRKRETSACVSNDFREKTIATSSTKERRKGVGTRYERHGVGGESISTRGK